MANRFRNPVMRREYDALVQAYREGAAILFTKDGRRCRGNAWATNFWLGFDDHNRDQWDRLSRKTLAYAHWRAGQDCQKTIAAREGKGKE